MQSQSLHNYNLYKIPQGTPFPQEVIEKLELNEASNGLVIGICKGKTEKPDSNLYAVLYRGQELVGVIVMTPPFGIVMSELGQFDRETIPFIVKSLVGDYPNIPSVVGPKTQALDFAKEYSNLTGTNHKLDMQLRIHQLEKVILPLKTDGIFRVANSADAGLIENWIEEFRKESTPNDAPHPSSFTIKEIAEGNFFIWENSFGEVVSIARKTRPTKNTISVNYVYTPPNLRGQGFASAVVAHLSQHLLDQGYKYCVLYTDLANPTSNSIYKKIGYEAVEDVDKYSFVT